MYLRSFREIAVPVAERRLSTRKSSNFPGTLTALNVTQSFTAVLHGSRVHVSFGQRQDTELTKKRVGYENDYENEIEHILLLIPHSTHDFQSVLRNVSTLFIK